MFADRRSEKEKDMDTKRVHETRTRNVHTKRKRWMMAAAIVACAAVVFLVLVWFKIISVTDFWADQYEVHGVDVSHYQGEIDWQQFSQSQMQFAFIKATEGSSHIDERFPYNWQEASKTDMRIGAYHFFSFDSPPRTQAELFIQTVGTLAGKLPPVVDVEYYGEKESDPPDVDETVENVKEMLDILEKQYGRKPILYTTYPVYRKYMRGRFEEYPLWIRNVYYTPDLDLDREWTFWQYSDSAVMDGYQGKEKFIDRNVFHGTQAELDQLLLGTDFE